MANFDIIFEIDDTLRRYSEYQLGNIWACFVNEQDAQIRDWSRWPLFPERRTALQEMFKLWRVGKNLDSLGENRR